MALRQIGIFDDKILRKKSRTVKVVDDKIMQILDDMADIMYNSKVGGLASLQVGILKRLVVIDMGQGLIKLVNHAQSRGYFCTTNVVILTITEGG